MGARRVQSYLLRRYDWIPGSEDVRHSMGLPKIVAQSDVRPALPADDHAFPGIAVMFSVNFHLYRGR